MKLLQRLTVRAIVPLLLPALLLTGCTGRAAVEASPDPSEGDELILNLSGLSADTVLFTVDGAEVPAESYLFWLAQTVSYMDQYNQTVGGTELDWDSDYAGSTLSEFCKNDAMETAKLYAMIDVKAQELGVTLTAEQQADLDATLESAVEQLGGEEAFNAQLASSALTRSAFDSFNKATYLYEGIQEKLFGAGGEKAPTDEAMDAYIEENDLLGAKHILLLTVDMSSQDATTGEYAKLDDATIAEKRATAEDLLAQLRASDDPEALFDTLMNEYSEDSGLSSYPDGYTFTAGEMVEEFENATRALEIGQISEIVESSYGYHIILRTDPDTESLREQYITDGMNEVVEDWVTNAAVVTNETYDALVPKTFYENLTAYRAELEAADAAESADPAATASAAPQG